MVEGECIICGKPVDVDEAVRCVECGSLMHRECFDEEILSDADGNPLCPRCALRAAVDWVDHILSYYAGSIREPDRGELRERLRGLASMLD